MRCIHPRPSVSYQVGAYICAWNRTSQSKSKARQIEGFLRDGIERRVGERTSYSRHRQYQPRLSSLRGECKLTPPR